MRRSNKSIYGSQPVQQVEEFDESAIDEIAKPILAYNRRLENIIRQMIDTQGANYNKELIMDRLKLLQNEMSAVITATNG